MYIAYKEKEGWKCIKDKGTLHYCDFIPYPFIHGQNVELQPLVRSLFLFISFFTWMLKGYSP